VALGPPQIAPLSPVGETPDLPREDGLAPIRALVSRFEGLDLAQSAHAELLDRRDTKFVVGLERVSLILEKVLPYYLALDVAGERVQAYHTTYFDTQDLRLYRDHHSARPRRYKIRSRRYVCTGQTFLEVKRKTARNQTIKARVSTPGSIVVTDPIAAAFLVPLVSVSPCDLTPSLECEFRRITLVHRHLPERATIDIDLSFTSGRRHVTAPGLAIVEAKQGAVGRRSEIIHVLRGLGAHPIAFSKYCVGIALLHDEVKHNRFRPELALVGRLAGEEARNG
jgi:VTC domain